MKIRISSYLKYYSLPLIIILFLTESHCKEIKNEISDSTTFCLQDIAMFLPIYESHKSAYQILKQQHQFEQWSQIRLNYLEKQLWVMFEIINPENKKKTIYFNGQNTDSTKIYSFEKESLELESVSGYLIPYSSRAAKDWGTIVSAEIPPNSSKKFLICLSNTTSNSSRLLDYVTLPCMRLYTESTYENDYKLPSDVLFLFLGAIAVMAIYNLAISFSTMYKEYLLFSLYNILTFLAAFYLTSIHYKLEIIEVSDYQRQLQYILAVLAFPSYLWFCIIFLEIKSKYTLTYRFLCGLSFSYIIPVLFIVISHYLEAFYSFTLITSIVLIILLFTSIKESFEYISARFMMIGNLLIFTTALAQILNITNIITSKELTFLVLSAQTLEIIIFSLAVAYKLKTSRKSFIMMKHRNELQKERLFTEAYLRDELEKENDRKSRALTSSSIQILNFSEQLNSLKKYIESEIEPIDKKMAKRLMKKIKNINSFEDQWDTFKIHFENVHPEFFTNLEKKFPSLSQNDHRLLAFMKMKLSNREISLILNVTKRAIEQSKLRLKSKLNLDSTKEILNLIESKDDINKYSIDTDKKLIQN